MSLNNFTLYVIRFQNLYFRLTLIKLILTKKISITILIASIVITTGYSQMPAKQWDYRFGGSGQDFLRSLQQTSDGGYILGGYSYSDVSGDKTQNSHGGSWDLWIIKLDESGTQRWDA